MKDRGDINYFKWSRERSQDYKSSRLDSCDFEYQVQYSVDLARPCIVNKVTITTKDGDTIMFLREQKQYNWMPNCFNSRLTRATLRKKIEELNEKIRQLAEGLINEDAVKQDAAWFVLRNIPIQFIQFEGVKILDSDVEHRFIPYDDEVTLAALNDFYLEHKYEYAAIPENHPIKRTVRRMKGLLESKGYSVKINDVYYLDGAE